MILLLMKMSLFPTYVPQKHNMMHFRYDVTYLK